MIATLSLTWRDAPSSVREVAAHALDGGDWQGLMGQGARGLCQVHTCARSLWILAAEDAAWAGALLQARLQVRLVDAGACAPPPQMEVGEAALRTVFAVSLGLDSVVEGEADVGAQVADAFSASAEAGRLCAELTAVWRATVELSARARREGVVRPGRGMGQLAVDALIRGGIGPADAVGVVGSGRIGQQVVASLRRAGLGEALVFNRTPQPGVRPLAELGGVAGLVVCTAAPEAWLRPPPGLRVVVDLGRPPQVVGRCTGLDNLLAGAGLRLDDAVRSRAEGLVDEAITRHAARDRAHGASDLLARVSRLRDEWTAVKLDRALESSLAELPPAARKRVLVSARRAFRRYGHDVIGVLRNGGAGSESGGQR
jgi:glutamyl-tRNA reductase